MNVLQGNQSFRLFSTNTLIHVFWFSHNSYAEYMSVPEIEFLVKIPDNMSLSVAAMLPSGALWALNTVQKAESVVRRISEEKGPEGNDTTFINHVDRILISFFLLFAKQECATFWSSVPVAWLFGLCVLLDFSSVRNNTASILPWPASVMKDFAWLRNLESMLQKLIKWRHVEVIL